MSSTSGKLKVYCQHCESKLDLTGHKPFSQVECPNCHNSVTVPMRFGHFILEEFLSQGAVFKTYRAMDLTLNRKVCVRIVRSEVAQNAELLKKVLKQAGRISMVSDDHIIPLFSSGEIDDQHYLVFQYLAGGSLRQHLDKAKGLLPLDTVNRVIYETAQAFTTGLRNNLLHGGISLNDIILDDDGSIKVGDFGFKRLLFETKNYEADSLFACEYLCPYVLQKTNFSNSDNIYALGALYYHLATGILPFPTALTVDGVKESLEKIPRTPRELRKEIPEDVSNFIMALMGKSPERIPESFADVADFAKTKLNLSHGSHSSSSPSVAPKQQIVVEASSSSSGSVKILALLALVAIGLAAAVVLLPKDLISLQEETPGSSSVISSNDTENVDPVAEAKSSESSVDAPLPDSAQVNRSEVPAVISAEDLYFSFEESAEANAETVALLKAIPAELAILAPLVKEKFDWQLQGTFLQGVTLTACDLKTVSFGDASYPWSEVSVKSLNGFLIRLEETFKNQPHFGGEATARISLLITALQDHYKLSEREDWKARAQELNSSL